MTIFQNKRAHRPQRIFLGLLLSSLIGLLAYRRKSLTRSGVAGAIVTGTTTFGLGGWSWGFSLIFFFLSSTLWSHFREKEKERTAADKFSKGSQRDIAQAAANGGVATMLAFGYGLSESAPETLRNALEAGYAGALATATADTWATEIGTLSSQTPRLITTGQPTPPGTSGGITLLGSVASALGALALGLVFWLLQGGRKAKSALPMLSLLSGLAGSFFDSLLGATLQATYYCQHCDSETERQVHSCGRQTHLLRGRPWMNNDLVNFLATLFGSLVASITSLLWRGRD
jgi:uncharacterized protein (TIGR00297 family)